MRKYLSSGIAVVALIAVIMFAFHTSKTDAPQKNPIETVASDTSSSDEPSKNMVVDKAISKTTADVETPNSTTATNPTPPEETPEQPENEPESPVRKCTLSVHCDTALANISRIAPEKAEILPQNGIIYPAQEVVFNDGESVFNVLLREMKRNKIHFEFENTPIYKSAYVEGIANLYEFDCGELSGWMYRVNDIFPNYGCSRYTLSDGDVIEWIYTCDLGNDIGGRNIYTEE